MVKRARERHLRLTSNHHTQGHTSIQLCEHTYIYHTNPCVTTHTRINFILQLKQSIGFGKHDQVESLRNNFSYGWFHEKKMMSTYCVGQQSDHTENRHIQDGFCACKLREGLSRHERQSASDQVSRAVDLLLPFSYYESPYIYQKAGI